MKRKIKSNLGRFSLGLILLIALGLAWAGPELYFNLIGLIIIIAYVLISYIVIKYMKK